MRKVMTLVGTRPELIKMSCVIAELDLRTKHVLVHSGQNYDHELNQVFFDEMGIRKPDHFLGIDPASPIRAIAEVLTKTDDLLALEKPDAFLVYGDTNTTLGVIAAKRRKIPVFHMEAGNRSFDQRVPEELNRKVLDHLSDINLVLSEHARRYLIAEGIRAETIVKTGSHMREVLDHFMPKIEASNILERSELERGKFFLVSAHREENVDSQARLSALVDTLSRLADEYGYPVLVSTHPRTRKRIDALGAAPHKLVRFVKPFGWFDYVKLEMSAACVISDSGTITEEASLLGLPAVTIRDAHERPEGIDEGTLIMCGLSAEKVFDAVSVTIAQQNSAGRTFNVVPDYQSGPVSKQVVRVVLSYIDYIDRTVWYKT